MQTCVLGKKDMREEVDSVFCALCMVCLGRAISWLRQGCYRQSMQHVQGTRRLGLVCVKILNTTPVLLTDVFFISGIINYKKSSGIINKTSRCFSRISIFALTFCLKNMSASKCLLNCQNLIVFFPGFRMLTPTLLVVLGKIPFSNMS